MVVSLEIARISFKVGSRCAHLSVVGESLGSGEQSSRSGEHNGQETCRKHILQAVSSQ